MEESSDKAKQPLAIGPIEFIVVHHGLEVPVVVYQDQYFSLMSLITDKLQVRDFGLCSGMGGCGTCQVSIYHGNGKLKRVALSCQVGIDDVLMNAKIIVPDNVY